MRQGPLAGRYYPVASMVVFALVPYLALSGALGPITPTIAGDLHMSLQTMSLGLGLANAAYAVGTVLAVQFAALLPQRRMMVLYAIFLVIGSVMTAAAQSPAMFIVGHVVQGLCTSLLLIAAAPPLFLGFPPSRLRPTAVIMNMCIFGAVALGPLIGGIQAGAHGWRPLFWVVAGIAMTALLLSVLTFEDAPPADPTAPKDPLAIVLAAVGSGAAFFGASQLLTHPFLGATTAVPLIGGLAVIVVLITSQSLKERPLLTIKSMLTSTIPVAGIVIALFAAAASVSATDLSANVLAPLHSPLHLGLLYLPEFAGAVITAIVLGAVLQRRGLQYLPLIGMLFLAAGIVTFRIELPPTVALTLVGSGLTGIGVGATVAPALFVAGFSLQALNLQRVFAIVELMRAVAAFMIAPVFAHFAQTVGTGPYGGTGIALWIGAGLAIAGSLIAVALYALGGARAAPADIEQFLAGEHPAWYSPPLLAAVRERTGRRVAEIHS
ncbi:MAG TPA: MFS transporter [Solirubrobacteraceae bacterium]|nr:MFS transporter [Solirubrobacteraceae bacterium]